MNKIKNIVFDFGGVLVDLNRENAVKRFEKLGVKEADALIDKYHQKGIFLEVEDGSINAEEFRQKISKLAGKELTFEEIQHAWLGFVAEISQYKLDYLLELRKNYKVYLLSNTNPYVMGWARSSRFTCVGRPLDDYVDKVYASYEIGKVKPDPAIFEYMIKDASLLPEETLFVDDGSSNIEMAKELKFHTYQPENKEDWREALNNLLQ